jgi:hypothetical protein
VDLRPGQGVGARVAHVLIVRALMPRGMPGRILVLVAVTLLAGASFCAFDADGTGLDLCSVVLLPVAGLLLGAPQPLVGRLVPVRIPMHPGAPLERPVPPPRA